MRTNDNGIDREMTAEEAAAHTAWMTVAAQEAEELAQAEAARIAAKESAKAKLAALGLTDDEINAIIGGV